MPSTIVFNIHFNLVRTLLYYANCFNDLFMPLHCKACAFMNLVCICISSDYTLKNFYVIFTCVYINSKGSTELIGSLTSNLFSSIFAVSEQLLKDDCSFKETGSKISFLKVKLCSKLLSTDSDINKVFIKLMSFLTHLPNFCRLLPSILLTVSTW